MGNTITAWRINIGLFNSSTCICTPKSVSLGTQLAFWVVLGWAYRGLTGGSFAPEFQCCYFCESSCLFYLSFKFDFYVSKIMHL